MILRVEMAGRDHDAHIPTSISIHDSSLFLFCLATFWLTRIFRASQPGVCLRLYLCLVFVVP